MRDEGELFLPRRHFAGTPSPYHVREKAAVVVLPVPYDGTTEWRSGTRNGPQAIIDASRYLEWYDLELDTEIYQAGIHTLPELEPVMGSPEVMVGRVYEAAKTIVKEGKLPVMLGGEHSLTLGMVKALKDKFPSLSVLQLDAHADLRDEYLGTKYSHACVMRRIYELCPMAQVGIRSLSQEEKQFLDREGLKPFYISSMVPGLEGVESVLARLSADVYVTVDMDVFDPALISAVGTPEPDGMEWREVVSLLRAVASSRHVVGFDVVELCPQEGPISDAFLAAKLIYKFMGYILQNRSKWEMP